MKVVISVGGSVLVPTVRAERVRQYAAVIDGLRNDGHEVGVVVGGGPTAREYIDVGRELGADEISLDQLGIAVTRLNARLLIAAVDGATPPTPLEDHESAYESFQRGEIPIMGGTAAGHTTDAVATALAEYIDADLLIYATSVPGVFDADPKQDADATKYDSLSPDSLLDVVSSIEMAAGSNAPVDLLATKLLQRSGLRAVVLDGNDPKQLRAAVSGTHDGTDIIPDHD